MSGKQPSGGRRPATIRAGRFFLFAAFTFFAIDIFLSWRAHAITRQWLIHGTGGAANDWAWAATISAVLAIFFFLLARRKR